MAWCSVKKSSGTTLTLHFILEVPSSILSLNKFCGFPHIHYRNSVKPQPLPSKSLRIHLNYPIRRFKTYTVESAGKQTEAHQERCIWRMSCRMKIWHRKIFHYISYFGNPLKRSASSIKKKGIIY